MNFKTKLPYAIALCIFAIASLLYFNPVLSGKKIKQGDITQFKGMSKEIVDYRSTTTNEPYWLGNAFSGMPAYQVSAYYPNDLVRYLDKLIRFLPRPADYLFLYFFGFFLLLTALKVNWKLAILGSLSFGFSTYLIIIFGAGHNAKAHAIGYMPFVLTGVIYVFQKKHLIGFLITAIAMALEIYANHPQMTYYLGFSLLILGIVNLIEALKNKTTSLFAKQVAILLVAMIIGLGVNATRLFSMKEYADYSTRGKSELTINPDGTKKQKSSGLDKAYITQYSYGIWETFNLIIPRFLGGGTVEKLDETSNFYQTLAQKADRNVAKQNSQQVLTYWGTQPIVEAPAYIGAIVFFLFFLGIYLVKGKLKYWLVSATIFAIILSWGKNLGIITNFFIDYIPLYNKFRAVSSIQVIAELSVPLLGTLALSKFFSSNVNFHEKEKALKEAFLTAGGISLFFLLFGSSLFAFEGLRDDQYQQLPELIDALIADRKAMLFNDSLRSFILIFISAGVLWLVLKKKINHNLAILSLTVLILVDLITVDIKYVNEEDFVISRKVTKPFIATNADKQILQDTTHYRVANFNGDLMQDGRTSYFHKSIGGYHAAKMKRYQELFDYQIAKEDMNMEVFNMLNAKYFIINEDEVQQNPLANGNAWFVNNIRMVATADEEIQGLTNLNTKTTAIYKNTGFENKKFNLSKQIDTTATIKLNQYTINKLEYTSTAKENQFAVFSEIFYKDGWKSFIDGNEVPHYRVNYVLRGMEIPTGIHTITFKFEPKVIQQGKIISLLSYGLLFLIPIGWFYFDKKKIKLITKE